MFSEITESINNLSDKISNTIEAIKNIGGFFNAIGEFFGNITYLISNPSVLFNLLQPWLTFLVLILIILKLIGFNTSKWIRLFLVFIIIVTIF